MMHRMLAVWVLLSSSALAQLPEVWVEHADDWWVQTYTDSVTGANDDLVVAGFARAQFSNSHLMIVDRYNASGQRVWAQVFGDPNLPEQTVPYDIAMDADGDVVIAGTRADQFAIWKLDGGSGSLIWVTDVAGDAGCLTIDHRDRDKTLALAADGSIFAGTCDTGMVRLDSGGNVVWQTPGTFGRITSVVASSDGNSYAAGVASDFLGYGVTAFDPNGGVRWSVSDTGVVGPILDISHLALYPNGDVLFAGGPETFCGVPGVHLRRYTVGGSEAWRVDLPETLCDTIRLSRIAIDSAARAYVISSVVSVDVRQYSPDGVLNWTRSYSTSPRQLTIEAAAIAPDDALVLTGEARRFGVPQDADVATVWFAPDGTVRADASFPTNHISGHTLALTPCGGAYVAGESWPGPEAFVLRYPASLAGDFDNDGDVTLSDLSVVLGNFGRTDIGRAEGDTNGDGQVDLADLGAVLATFGSGC